eukprot:3887676-Rhodomonas_salina.1
MLKKCRGRAGKGTSRTQSRLHPRRPAVQRPAIDARYATRSTWHSQRGKKRVSATTCSKSTTKTRKTFRSGLCRRQEWPEFIGALRTPLPATFRLNARHPVGAKLLQRLQAGEFDMPDVKDPDGRSLRLWRWRGKPIPYTVKQVRGVPRSEAWQFGFDRAGFRAARKLTPADSQTLHRFALLAKLYSEMHAAESRGAAARQEVVSMLPALLLRPQAGGHAKRGGVEG